MSMKSTVILFLGVLCGLMLLAGCSDDATTPADAETLELIDAVTIIESVAPPEFTAPTGAPSAIDSVWTEGEYALLGKVFGPDDPPALHRNINDFQAQMEILESRLLVDTNGNLIEGVFSDTATADFDGTPTLIHVDVTVTALSAPITIPAEAADVIGATADLDYLVTIELEEVPEGTLHLGITVNDTEQTLLLFEEGMGDTETTGASLKYLSLDPTDSTFTFKGIGYYDHGESVYGYAFDITSDANSDFSYRMSWYSNDLPEDDLLGCILGGGNRETEFALIYRQYKPADTTVMDSVSMYDAVFGPDYSDGEGLITDYSDYLDEDLIFGYDIVPQAIPSSPWEEE